MRLDPGLLARGNESTPPQVHVSLPVSSACGGTLPGIDLNDTAALLDTMEGRP